MCLMSLCKALFLLPLLLESSPSFVIVFCHILLSFKTPNGINHGKQQNVIMQNTKLCKNLGVGRIQNIIRISQDLKCLGKKY